MTESLKDRAEAATKEVQGILGGSGESNQEEIADAIERSITNALVEERKRCADVATECLSDDRETGERVAEEINRINSALIANLSAMR